MDVVIFVMYELEVYKWYFDGFCVNVEEIVDINDCSFVVF